MTTATVKNVIGVMGPGKLDPGSDRDRAILASAYALGQVIARESWVLLTGGRAAGVMEEASRGAAEAGGIVLGILPDADTANCSSFVSIAVPTAMGSARNNINILASHVVVTCGMGAGTASEAALAIKAGKSVIMLHPGESAAVFFQELAPSRVKVAEDVAAAIAYVKSDLLR